MGFTTGEFPPVDPGPFLEQPLRTRMQTLAVHWGEYGFGSPKMIPTTYVAKVILLYIVAGTAIITQTSGVGPFWDIGGWWDQPIVWQKLVLWTALLEAIGLAGSWGPIAGKFKPMTGGITFWARPGTIRLRPWKRVPFTDGDVRTPLDALMYLLLLSALVVAVLAGGSDNAELTAARPEITSGLLDPLFFVIPAVLLVLIGLRDKTIFLAARSEQYLPAMIIFATLGFTDMIISGKILICIVWIGAGISKFGHHFSNVVPPMVSNSPCIPSLRFKRAQYRNFPADLRPSKVATLLAHVGGSAVEIVTPIVLLTSTNSTVTMVAVVLMVIFHLFIISTFPLAVPLEWNVLFSFLTVFLFVGHPNADGFAVWDVSSIPLAALIVAALVAMPILGNLRPDLVSFLPSMRQYAGNWASALWAFAPGAEEKLNQIEYRPTSNQVDQLQALGYEPDIAEITMQQTIAWRAMHSQGRGLFSVLYKNLRDIEERTIREAEFACNSLIGFNFGDGHLHDESLVAAVQSRVGFEPGEWIVVWVESQAIHSPNQAYQVIDAALGVIERGTWRVRDAVDAQPWLPDGPIDLDVTWRADGRTGRNAGSVLTDTTWYPTADSDMLQH